MIFAIDPGTTHSAWVLLADDGKRILRAEYGPNDEILGAISALEIQDRVYCEMIASYGMAVGRETFETCVWIGRFEQATPNRAERFVKVYRKDIKLHLCGSLRAKDANIRRALMDAMGEPGTKKKPGPTYGISKHLWAALAVAKYAADTYAVPTKKQKPL